MSHEEVIRAWADLDFRARLSPEQVAALPPHPAGSLDALLARLAEPAPGSDDAVFFGMGTPDPDSRACCAPPETEDECCLITSF